MIDTVKEIMGIPRTPTAGSKRARKAERTRASTRILVVDDEAVIRAAIGAALEQNGYAATLVASEAEATAQLETSAFDLLLTEIGMREGSGFALLERARASHPHLPMVVVTAVHDISAAIEAMRLGAYDYILKPFEQERLTSAVARALEHGQVLRASRNYQQNLEALEEIVQARTEMLQQAMMELEHSYDVTLEALGDALDLKDAETEGHSKRVTAYTIALARAMGIAPDEIKTIARGAFLHDIGKMAIPDEILRKPGPLTPDEQAVMREHCALGYNILRKIPFLSGSAEIVFSHQEHFDGTGYPSATKGAEIPIGSRIFAVADTLDAMTSDRPYRKARGFDAARAEILRCSGTQFDPAVVEAFLKIPDSLWTELREEITGQQKRFTTFGVAASPDGAAAAKP